MFRNLSCNILAGTVNINGTAFITCKFMYHMRFQIFLKDDYRLGRQIFNFRVSKMI